MRHLTSSLFLGLFASSTLMADEITDRVEWLKKNARTITTIDPQNEDFADLEGFGKAIGDARIVFLGEQTHGDGATFHAKTRLIKYLHQKKGFDVLAFESGFYDCRAAWQQLKAGKKTPREAVEFGVFGIWTQSKQFEPLIDYLGKQAPSKTPLEICGFDCQFTAVASREKLTDDLAGVLVGLETISDRQIDSILQMIETLVKDDKIPTDADQRDLERAIQLITDAKPTKKVSEADLSYWRQFFQSAKGQMESLALNNSNKSKSGAARDTQMAKNLIWLAREAYPKRKLIIWAASYHNMRNPNGITFLKGDERDEMYKRNATVVMGHEAWPTLGQETYSVMFTAAEGSWKLPWFPKPNKMTAPPAGSLDDLFVKAKFENAFLDLKTNSKTKAGAWLAKPLITRPLGHGDAEAIWPDVFDGVFFTKTMFGSDRITSE